MPQYLFTGRVTYSVAVFFVTANSADEAKGKARAGKFDLVDTDSAEIVDWEIRPDTCTLNE
jgi:hypothetical protein